MTTRIFKPIYINEQEGELGRMPDGAILNIGGTSGPGFTVGGRGLLFDDGSSTSPNSGSGFTLQIAYGNSTTPAEIVTTAGKDIVFTALNTKKFIFDADTGTVTVEGNLNVLGSSTVIDGTVSNLDQVNISPPLPGTTALNIVPLVGIVPTVNLVSIKALAGGPDVFSIGPTGITSLSDLIIGGTLNGVAVADILGHLDTDTVPAKHTAEQVAFDDTGLTNITGSDVQAAIESIDSQLTSIGVGNVTGFEYVQLTPSAVWPILHNVGSTKVQCTVWDETNSAIWPDAMTVVDGDTVYVTFASPQAGRAILMLF